MAELKCRYAEFFVEPGQYESMFLHNLLNSLDRGEIDPKSKCCAVLTHSISSSGWSAARLEPGDALTDLATSSTCIPDGETCTFSAIPIFPTPGEWANHSPVEYINANVKIWAAELAHLNNRQVTEMLGEIEGVFSCAEEDLIEGLHAHVENFGEGFYADAKPFLVRHLGAGLPVMLVGHVGKHMLGMLKPSLAVDSGNLVVYSLPFVLLDSLYIAIPEAYEDFDNYLGQWFAVEPDPAFEDFCTLKPIESMVSESAPVPLPAIAANAADGTFDCGFVGVFPDSDLPWQGTWEP
jgi:hypothetical protein